MSIKVEISKCAKMEELISAMKIDAVRMRNKFTPETMSDFVDIDKFIEVLYSLLESNNYLLKDGDDPDPSKFLFTEEYPDMETEKKNVVTFEIFKRTPANLSANAEPFKGTTHYRPMYLGEEQDGKDGGVTVHLMSMYDNLIRFRCWSEKTSQARKLATLLESILTKYYWVLKQYVPVLVYEGRGNGRISNEYGDNRYQGIYADLFVRTNETHSLKEQEIVSFETQIQLSTCT